MKEMVEPNRRLRRRDDEETKTWNWTEAEHWNANTDLRLKQPGETQGEQAGFSYQFSSFHPVSNRCMAMGGFGEA